MKIELKQIKVRDVADGYVNNDEDNSVVGYGGKLNIRPKYQREFVYKDKQRDEVINTIKHDFPLNVMYWCKNDDGTFEVLDGQQRTISICEYIDGKFSFEGKYFHNLTNFEKDQILNYDLIVLLRLNLLLYCRLKGKEYHYLSSFPLYINIFFYNHLM